MAARHPLGDPSSPTPQFDPEHQSAAAQEKQFGYNCDYLDILPMDGRRGRRALAVVNHEYTNENIMFPPTTDPATLAENKRIAMAAHGLTVVELRRSAPGRPWTYVRDSGYNRRLTAQTPFALTGPAAGHPLLQTKDDPVGRVVLGTQNNCAGGTTPWGTVLSGEENFNQYFVANATPETARYGIPTSASGRGWWTVDPRFDARQPLYENEVNRFGCIVEVDPEDPTSTPVKHTALGRFKHEGATIRVADDGQWIPLVEGGASRVPGMSVAEVLVFTRIAADRVGATKMDRPEDIEPNPATGKVYLALTNNTNRGRPGLAGADEANPRTPNREGHVLELTESGNDAAATTFAWTLLLVCGLPESAGTYFGGYEGPVSPISCPDNVAFDDAGDLWISTDGQPGTIGLDDAPHRVTLTGSERGRVEQFLAVPRDAETCGPVIDSLDEMVYVAVQHPGEEGSWAAQRSFFPDYLPQGALEDGGWGGPRPSVIQVFRTDR